MGSIPRFARVLGTAALLAGGGAWATTAADAVLTVQGSNQDDYFGTSLAAVGDVNGDGAVDYVVGTNGGYVIVFSGADGSPIHTLKGSSTDLYGASVAGVPDTNGDGYDDILVGAPQEYNGKQQTGAAHLYSGQDGSLLYDFFGDNAGDYFGGSVTGVGDLDGDGCGDVVVGARTALDPNVKASSPGMVHVYSGKGGSWIATLYGDVDLDNFGASVANLGDVDGDGLGDFAVGAEYADDGTGIYPGSVRIFSGKSQGTIATLYGDQDFDSFGAAVASAGDVDGDKIPDLIVGAPAGADKGGTYTGYVRVFAGADWSTLHTTYGDADGDQLGRAVSSSEDLSGDGSGDLLVGCPWMANEKGSYTGTVRLLSGTDGSTLGTIYGSNADDAFGWTVAPVVDVTGDSIPDVIVGIPYDDGAGSDAGAVVVVSGATTSVPSGTVLIDDDATSTNSNSVTLSLAWTDGSSAVTEMRFRDAGGTWTDWEAVADSAQWTLPTGDGTKTVEVQFRDETAIESAAASDSIVLDQTSPTGTVVINDGAAWTKSTGVTLKLTSSDAGTGVARFRVRNAGGSFGAPLTAATGLDWTLASGSGSNTVEVEFEDGAGNLSSIVSDAISVDQIAPTGTIVIENGAAVVRQRTVTLKFSASDTGGSGLTELRTKRASTPTWGPWQPYTGAIAAALVSGDGTQEVQAQFRDTALNESAVVSDTIVLDEGLPVITAFALHDPRPFYLPLEAIGFDLSANDATGGTGIDSARTTWDGGATWTPWTDVSGGGVYTPERPPLEGPATAQVVVRDRAGNESERSTAVSMQFVPLAPPDARSGGTGKGAMSDLADVDVLALDLVKGDTLNVTLTVKSGIKKQPFVLALDLARPTGERLFEGRFPANLKSPGIKGFVAPATGRYLLIVRHADATGAPNGTYSMKLAVKQAKANGTAKGTAAAGEFSFDAAAGATFSGTLKGAGLDPATVVLEGPDGAIPVTAKLKAGKVTISPVKLPATTGTYKVRFTATGPVAFTWKVVLPKATAKVTLD